MTTNPVTDTFGDVFGYLDHDKLQAESKHIDEITSEGTPIGYEKYDYGLDLGGYFLKDRLWFFGAYDRVRNTLDRRITQGPEAGTVATTDTRGDLYSGKLTFRLTDQHTLVGTVFGDPTDDAGAVAPIVGPPSTYIGTVNVGGTDLGGRYEGILSEKFLVTGQFGYHRENVNRLPGPDGDQIAYQDLTGDVTTSFGGFGGVEGTSQFDRKTFTRYDYRLDGNYFLASHDIKVGFEFERVNADVFRDYSGGQLVQILPPWEDDPQQRRSTSTPFSRARRPDRQPTVAPVLAFPQHDVFSVYARDRFSVLPNLTINAGVRWEKQLIKGLDQITFINVDHFSPRAGFTWDFLNDGRGKVYAAYSHFVQIVPLDMNIRSLNGERDGATFNFDPVDRTCNPEAERADQDSECVIPRESGRGGSTRSTRTSSRLLRGGDRRIERHSALMDGRTARYLRSLRRRSRTRASPRDGDNYGSQSGFSAGRASFTGLSSPRRVVTRAPPCLLFSWASSLTLQKRALAQLCSTPATSTRACAEYDGAFRAVGAFRTQPEHHDDFDYPEFQVNAYGRLTLDRRTRPSSSNRVVFPSGSPAAPRRSTRAGRRSRAWAGGTRRRTGDFSSRSAAARGARRARTRSTCTSTTVPLGPVTLHLLADLFNLLDRQQILEQDQVWAFDQASNEDPVPANEHYGLANNWQQPRTLRLGVRVSF